MKTTETSPSPGHSYGKTNLSLVGPWQIPHRRGSRVLCSDGKIRSLSYIANSADTFFSIPAGIKVNGKYVTGYVTGEEEGKAPYRRAMSFRQHNGHGSALPDWPDSSRQVEKDELIAKAHA